MASEPAAGMQYRVWRGWFAATIAAITLGALGDLSWDGMLARFFNGRPDHHLHLLGMIFSSPHLIAALTLLVGILAGIRIWSGRLSQIGKSALIASAAALFTFSANDFVLKGIFGRPSVSEYLESGATGFRWLSGSSQSSFPSGHAAMAAAMLAVMASLHPKLAWAAMVAQALACGLMVMGGWHFVSDTIAGTWLGATAGLLAAELWRQHLCVRPSQA